MSAKKKQTKNVRRVFTDAFKIRMVKQMLSGKKKIAQIAEDFDVHFTLLYAWKKKFGDTVKSK